MGYTTYELVQDFATIHRMVRVTDDNFGWKEPCLAVLKKKRFNDGKQVFYFDS